MAICFTSTPSLFWDFRKCRSGGWTKTSLILPLSCVWKGYHTFLLTTDISLIENNYENLPYQVRPNHEILGLAHGLVALTSEFPGTKKVESSANLMNSLLLDNVFISEANTRNNVGPKPEPCTKPRLND